jgi:hypothetical protein
MGNSSLATLCLSYSRSNTISIIPQTFALPKTDVQPETQLEPSNGN